MIQKRCEYKTKLRKQIKEHNMNDVNDSFIKSSDAVNAWLEHYAVKFGIYKNGVFKEQLFP